MDGARIISNLFQVIIDQNHLNWKISEIEGDAILFYRFGKPFPQKQILFQFKIMLQLFNEEIKRLQDDYPAVTNLGLKAVVHYGDMSTYTIQHFYKLYGKALVDAHRLLKNSIADDCYVLITKEYIDGLTEYNDSGNILNGFEQCDLYDVGNLCYTYFPFDKDFFEKPEPLIT